MTGQERCSEEECFLVARAALRVGAQRGLGFGSLCTADVTVATVGDVVFVVLISTAERWQSVSMFRGLTLLASSAPLMRFKDPVYGTA